MLGIENIYLGMKYIFGNQPQIKKLSQSKLEIELEL